MPLASRSGAFRPTLTFELPLSRWHLDEVSGAGGIFADLGAAGVDMQLQGSWADLTAQSLVQGLGGTSAYTDGSAYATIPAGQAAHDLAALTISLYYQRNDTAEKHVLLAGADGSDPGSFSVEVMANGRLRAWHIGQDAALRFFEDTDGVVGTDVAVGTGHRIELSLGPAGARLYLDGAQVASILANTNGWNNGGVKFLGRWIDGVLAPAVGAFDQVQIWPRQLTAGEIAALRPARRIQLPGHRFLEVEVAHLVAVASPAALRPGLRMEADRASGEVVVYDAALRQRKAVLAATATVEIAAYGAAVLRRRRLVADAATLALTAPDAGLVLRDKVLVAEAAALEIAAYDASLAYRRAVVADAATLALTGYDARLVRGPAPLVAETASLELTAHDAALLARSAVVADSASMELAAYEAALLRHRRLPAAAASMELAAAEAALLHHRRLPAAAASMEAAAYDAGLAVLADIVHVGAAYNTSDDDNVSSIAVDVSAIALQSGDLIIALGAHALGTARVDHPSGYNEIVAPGGTLVSFAVSWEESDGMETSITFPETTGPNAPMGGLISVYRGADFMSGPLGGTPQTSNATANSADPPEYTPAVAGEMIICWAVVNSPGGTFPTDGGGPTGFDVVYHRDVPGFSIGLAHLLAEDTDPVDPDGWDHGGSLDEFGTGTFGIRKP